ncbi:unnamed protein product [Adineta steineri]|uniref:Uncharacterized protein n=1 Tax=Adineta steineri TaxID=433720 RepID=A0A819SZM3_9BILA|nr:unnamed protein product [Adineta steineri]CAF1066877.1 unnamed protein product [Adineta steineri]CAF4069314.1 unnamed protein product [Adineta steineri]CAF4172529.1 unnamed protein product [Adineta steineri]
MVVVANNESKVGSSLTSAFLSAFQHRTAIQTDSLLGISVEPLTQLEQQVQPNDVTPSNVEFVSKMFNNFVNYIISVVQNVPGTSEQIELYVPRKCAARNKIIESKDHAAVQLDIVEHTGRMTENGRIYALCG